MSLAKSIKNNAISKLFSIQKKYDLELIFSLRELNSRYDVLLDLNLLTTSLDSELPLSLRRFEGIKLAHVGDYFAYHSSLDKNNRLKEIGTTALLGYCMHDHHCDFFREHYKDFLGKVWGIPMSFSKRFRKYNEFENRKDMAISLGSLFKLNNESFSKKTFFEAENFFENEAWFHRFREKLFRYSDEIRDLVFCGIPNPNKKNSIRLDLVEAFNSYKFFVTCETVFNFPTAKIFEGIACGSILLASNNTIYKELGFINNKHFISFENEDLNNMQDKILYFLENEPMLKEIAHNSHSLVMAKFNPKSISSYLIDICSKYSSSYTSIPEPISTFEGYAIN